MLFQFPCDQISGLCLHIRGLRITACGMALTHHLRVLSREFFNRVHRLVCSRAAKLHNGVTWLDDGKATLAQISHEGRGICDSTFRR